MEEDSDEDSEEEKLLYQLINFLFNLFRTVWNTLDYLFVNNLIKDEELGCVIVQILMILITYQNI